jgi:hypothetical protein
MKDMFIKLKFEMWVEDNSSDAGEPQKDGGEPDCWGNMLDLISGELEQWNGLLVTSTLMKKADTIAEIKEDFARQFFLAKLSPESKLKQ